MLNAMPSFAVMINRVVIGRVSAVSHAQAMTRASKLARKAGHSRFELVADATVPLDKRAAASRVSDMSYSAGRSPYPTPGFEARRAALIAQHKANA